MNDSHWTDRLSEYLDGDLAAAERDACEAHLAGCAECARLLEDLKAVALHARALPPVPPPAELWSTIESRLETPVLSLRARSELRERLARRFTFSGLQLAGAAAALVAVTVAAMWLATRGTPGPAGPSAGAPVAIAPRDTTPQPGEATEAAPELALGGREEHRDSGDREEHAERSGREEREEHEASRPRRASRPSAEAGSSQLATYESERRAPTVPPDFGIGRYEAAIAELETSLAAQRGKLDSSTVRIVAQNLDIIDKAIADARTALAADPASRYLNAHLASTMRRKVDMLRRVNSLTRI